MNEKLKNAINYIKRHAAWFVIGIISIILLKPGLSEIRTMILIAAVESLALALSGVAAYAYTRIDFVEEKAAATLGYIFLAVHICVGLVVTGVYIAQFAN